MKNRLVAWLFLLLGCALIFVAIFSAQNASHEYIEAGFEKYGIQMASPITSAEVEAGANNAYINTLVPWLIVSGICFAIGAIILPRGTLPQTV